MTSNDCQINTEQPESLWLDRPATDFELKPAVTQMDLTDSKRLV